MSAPPGGRSAANSVCFGALVLDRVPPLLSGSAVLRLRPVLRGPPVVFVASGLADVPDSSELSSSSPELPVGSITFDLSPVAASELG
jgi:hypothetical protein